MTTSEAEIGPYELEDYFSLSVIRSAGSLVLGRKTRGYGAGKLALPGGKDHYYLSELGIGLATGPQNASREIYEEVGLDIDPQLIARVGILYVSTEDDNKDVAIYEVTCRQASLTNTDELESVNWYPEDSLPYEEMPADYKLWLPSILAGYMVTAYLETDHDEILEGKLFRQQINPLGRLEQVLVEQS